MGGDWPGQQLGFTPALQPQTFPTATAAGAAPASRGDFSSRYHGPCVQGRSRLTPALRAINNSVLSSLILKCSLVWMINFTATLAVNKEMISRQTLRPTQLPHSPSFVGMATAQSLWTPGQSSAVRIRKLWLETRLG